MATTTMVQIAGISTACTDPRHATDRLIHHLPHPQAVVRHESDHTARPLASHTTIVRGHRQRLQSRASVLAYYHRRVHRNLQLLPL